MMSISSVIHFVFNVLCFFFDFDYLFICYTFFSLSFVLYIFYIVLLHFFLLLFGLVVVRIVCGSFFLETFYITTELTPDPNSNPLSSSIFCDWNTKHKFLIVLFINFFFLFFFIWRIVFKDSWYKLLLFIWFWEEEQDWKLTWFRIRDEYSSLNWSSVWENCEISVSNQQYNAEQ